jgi:hypothetical protein
VRAAWTKLRANLLLLVCILWGNVAFAGPSTPEVAIHFTVQKNSIQWSTNRTCLMFMCRVVMINSTSNFLTVSNLFQDRAGLCMKIMDKNGTELSRLNCGPFHWPTFTYGPGTNVIGWPYYVLFLSGTNDSLKLQWSADWQYLYKSHFF